MLPGRVKGDASLPAAELLALRRRYLSEGQEAARQMLLDLDGQFNANEAAKQVHNWIGTGGLLGYSAISRLAREVEAVLLERPLENDQLRDSLTNLALARLIARAEARDAPLSESIVHALSGKRVALVGLPASDAQRMCVALERTQSVPVFFEATEPPSSKAVLECHLAVVHVRPEMGESKWLEPRTAYTLFAVGVRGERRDHLLSLDQSVQSLANEFLMDSWQPEEALVRLKSGAVLATTARPQRGGSLPLLGTPVAEADLV